MLIDGTGDSRLLHQSSSTWLRRSSSTWPSPNRGEETCTPCLFVGTRRWTRSRECSGGRKRRWGRPQSVETLHVSVCKEEPCIRARTCMGMHCQRRQRAEFHPCRRCDYVMCGTAPLLTHGVLDGLPGGASRRSCAIMSMSVVRIFYSRARSLACSLSKVTPVKASRVQRRTGLTWSLV